jgi:proteasome beta subunit
MKAEVELYKLKRQASMNVKSAATLLSNILHRGGGAAGYYYVGLIIGGVDKTGGHVYSIDAAGGSIRDDYASVGSGSLFAYGVLEDNYEKGMSMDQTVDLAMRALNAAMKRDSASGDGMAIIIITKDGYKELNDDELRKKATKLGLDYPKAR